MVAILDFPLPVMSGNLQKSTIGNLDPEDMGVAVGILFLSNLEVELCMGVFLPLIFIASCLY